MLRNYLTTAIRASGGRMTDYGCCGSRTSTCMPTSAAGRRAPAPDLHLPDLPDGTLEDWEAVLPDASLDHNSFELDGGQGGGIDPSDLAGTGWWSRLSLP